MARERFTSSITSVSWIPSEAIGGLTRLPFDLGVGHYDDPPPEVLGDLDALHKAGAFRFANRLHGWLEVEDGRVVDHGHLGRSYLNSTLLRFGRTNVAFQPTGFPDLRPDPEVTPAGVRFIQTAGGRPGVPAPRLVPDLRFFRWAGPSVWTTLSLTIGVDGSAQGELLGASTFPRHWIYDDAGALAAKSGVIDFEQWYHGAFDEHTPWGDEDTPAFVAMAETALERQVSSTIMRRGARPEMFALQAGGVAFEQGDRGDDVYLVLDGLLDVEVDGAKVAEIGPGAVVGERSLLEGAGRTATVRALTDCRLARADRELVDLAALEQIAAGHRREEEQP
jgi:hypothetical protein